jgi:hypothetical protein
VDLFLGRLRRGFVVGFRVGFGWEEFEWGVVETVGDDFYGSP